MTINVNEDGTVALLTGTPDIGGSRASLSMMAAEELGIHVDKVRPMIADTASLPYTFLTGGSRATFAGTTAIIHAAKDAIDKMRGRAAPGLPCGAILSLYFGHAININCVFTID